MREGDIHGIFALVLAPFAVHEHSGQASVEQEVIELLNTALGVAEDQSQTRVFAEEQVVTSLALALSFHEHNVLLHVLVCGSSTANTNADVVLGHVLARKTASVTGKGGAEHQVDVICVLIGVFQPCQSMWTKGDRKALAYHHQPSPSPPAQPSRREASRLPHR